MAWMAETVENQSFFGKEPMTPSDLTTKDVEALLHNPSAEKRAETAAKLAGQLKTGELSQSERDIASDIFRIMVKDAEVRVRKALSDNVKDNPDLPHDVARALADDVETVALPILNFSQVLTDDDLIEIIESQGEEKLEAIAKRETVHEAVSEALVDKGSEKVVETLVSNAGAELDEDDFMKVVDKFGGKEGIQKAMVDRAILPVTVSEKLVALVSENLKQTLVERHELSADKATDLVLSSRERATIGLSADSSEDDVEKLVHQLNKNGRLTSSICLRALCMGDLVFFEAALSELIKLPLVNARELIHDGGQLGLKAIYQKAGLPAKYYPAARAAVDVARETGYDGEANDRERYSRRVLERVLTQYDDLGVELADEDLAYLLEKLDHLPGDIV